MAENDLDTTATGTELPGVLDGLTARTRELESGANAFARAMTQAFSRAVIDGKRFEDVLKGLVLRLSNLAVRLAFKPLERGFASAFEGLFAAFGNAKPFADGGVIASPTYFPLGRGGVGLAGEAGPEAILPLARGADGRLGVAAGGTRHAVAGHDQHRNPGCRELPPLRSLCHRTDRTRGRTRPAQPLALRMHAVAQTLHAGALGAMVATEEGTVLLQSVADNAHAAHLAGGRQRLDGAFEAVEGMGLARLHHLERLVVVVSAGFALSHGVPFRSP